MYKLLCGTLFAVLLVCTVRAEVTNVLGMRFVEVPSGSFFMGTEDVEDALSEFPSPKETDVVDETPYHKVRIDAFLMGQTEVTQKQWLEVMENRPGNTWQRDNWENLPVNGINWFMAQRFTQELSALDKQYDYRLPTEAEWEYAARAGDQGMRPDEVEDYAWFIINSDDITHPVGTRKPNAFGLYDMMGNVWEWVDDWYSGNTYADRFTTHNPQGPADGTTRVRRGGSHHCPEHFMRFAHRAANLPNRGFSVDGFRVVAVPKK